MRDRLRGLRAAKQEAVPRSAPVGLRAWWRARLGLRTVAFLSVANRLAAVIGALAPPALAVLVPGASLLVLCVVPLCVS